MKVVILAGGHGSRISEESHLKPKPMIKIGEMPILWHIMKIYSEYNINDFVICCGYKEEMIKEYFSKFDSKSWNIELVNTGLDTMTGGRIKRIQNHIDDTFCLTYGDGLSDVNITDLISFHKEKKSLATLTAVHPPERYGVVNLSEHYVAEFHEKHTSESSWINGGFFVFEPQIFNFLSNKNTMLEREPINKLVKKKQLAAYQHRGFWHCMDTMRDKILLNKIWNKKKKW